MTLTLTDGPDQLCDVNTQNYHHRQTESVLQTTSVGMINGDKGVEWMRKTLSDYFSYPRHHVSNDTNKARAKNFIKEQFEDMGLEVYMQTFDTRLPEVKGVNVIGVLRGQHFNTSSDSLLAIGAHYDTMRGSPGVNDNGAGVVTLIQTARALSSHKKRNATLLFVAFDFEEYENKAEEDNVACSYEETMCGSKKLVSDWLPTLAAWPTHWRGIVVMDTILNFNESDGSQTLPPELGQLPIFAHAVTSVLGDGSDGDFMTVIGRTEDSGFISEFNRSWYAQGEKQYEIEILSAPGSMLPMMPDLLRSDHKSFLEQNASAIFLTDTAGLRGYMERCYHQACDNMQHVTDERLGFIDKTSDSLVHFLNQLAPHSATSGAATERAKLQGWMCLWLLLMAMSCCL